MGISTAIATSHAVTRLTSLCSVFDGVAAKEKLTLLKLLAGREIRAIHLLKRLHSSLCYLRAFPDNKRIYDESCSALDQFGQRIGKLDPPVIEKLNDSGIAQTKVCYQFAYSNMMWLARNFPQNLEIDWSEGESLEKLDSLLQLLVSTPEQQIFDNQSLTTAEYLRIARGEWHASDLDWLFRLCVQSPRSQKFIEALYDSSGAELIWHLRDCTGSLTQNCLVVPKVHYRRRGMRLQTGRAAVQIVKPMPITHLGRHDGNALLDVVKAALLVRSREVYHMQYGSPDAIYLGSAGEGIQIAFIGALPERRFSLDVSFGYVVFSNGVPVAYGGISPLFGQGNTGLNVLDEYRRGESAFLYTQVLRMGHSMFACKRFIANPYQFGEDNPDALRSGAFWFYYRLGFRPVDKKINNLATREFEKISQKRGYRTSMEKLKRLASGDIHLVLPGAEPGYVFKETWLDILAIGSARKIAAQGSHHKHAISSIVSELCEKLGIKTAHKWPANQREQLRQLAPVCGLIDDIDQWNQSEKRALIKIIREKGALSERNYARLMAGNRRFFSGLRRYCRQQEK